MSDDEKLKGAFSALKKEDARRAPSFEAILHRPKRRRSAWAVVVPLASATAAAAAVLMLWSSAQLEAPRSAAPSPAAPAVVAGAGGLPPPRVDSAPLDFLLDLPGGSAIAATSSFDAKVFR